MIRSAYPRAMFDAAEKWVDPRIATCSLALESLATASAARGNFP
jgi:hypothetical protein